MFLLFKRIYRSGHFHNKKVPVELGITRPTFRKYLKKFMDNDWAERWGGTGFRLRGIRQIQKRLYQADSKYCFSKIITLKNYKNKYDLKTQLRWIALSDKHDQIKYATTCKKLRIHYSELRKLPKAIHRLVMATPCKVEMSVLTMGDTIKRSKSTGARVKKELIKMGMLKAKWNEVKIYKSNVSQHEWRMFKSSDAYKECYCYSKLDTHTNGIIFENRPDLITMINPHQVAPNNSCSGFFQYNIK